MLSKYDADTEAPPIPASPHTLSSETISGSGLRARVARSRKRLARIGLKTRWHLKRISASSKIPLIILSIFVGIAILWVSYWYFATARWYSFAPAPANVRDSSSGIGEALIFGDGNDGDTASGGLCRNTIQGAVWTTDSHGFICHRLDLDRNTGCCSDTHSNVRVEQIAGVKMKAEITSENSRTDKAIAKATNRNSTSTSSSSSSSSASGKSMKAKKGIMTASEEAMEFMSREGLIPRIRYSCAGCRVRKRCCRYYEFCVSCCMRPDMRKSIRRTVNRLKKDRILNQVKTVFEFCSHACRTSSRSVVHENVYAEPHRKHCFSLSGARNRKDSNLKGKS